MKILFVLTYYRPHWTGLTQYAARLAEGLVQRGHRVEVLCVQHQKDLAEEEVVEGVKITRLPFLFKFIRSLIAPLFPLKLWQLAHQNEVVVIYLPFLEVLVATLIVRLAGKRLFLVHNGDLILPQEGGFFNRLVEKAYYLTTSFSIHFSNAIIVQTEDYSKKSKLLSPFERKWRILLPLYEVPKIKKREVDNFIKKHNLGGKKLIGFSGRFVEEKGVDYLLTAIPLVLEEVSEVHFVFAGEHKIYYEKFWEKIAPLVRKNKKYLTFLGLIKDKHQIANFYGVLDALVQPSRTDCFPSTQVEAMLCGAPVVCTDIPGARWVVKATGMGEIVKPHSPEALAGGIVKILKNKEKYLKPRKEIEKVFNYEKTIEKYERLFKN